MKNLILAVALLFGVLAAAEVRAAPCATYPFTLTNGQTADANQVMANFNAILNCANTNLATAGTNSNITALTGLTTPLSVGQGGTGATTLSGLEAALGGPFLVASDNLSDVVSPSTALTNLGAASVNDSRFAGPTQNSESGGYAFVLTDGGKQIYHPSADTTARAWVIPANASVAFAIGVKIELVNDCSAGAITLSITSDTLEWFPAGTTGTRTIAACGTATITKLTATEWMITGVGVS